MNEHGNGDPIEPELGFDPEDVPEPPPSLSPEGTVLDEIPDVDQIEPEDVPHPLIDEVTDEAIGAIEHNENYWRTQDLVYAGRLSKTKEFLPGRKVRLHTPDQGELNWIGRRLDIEFGKVDVRTGISAAYDNGIKLITLSVVLDDLDDTPLYSPAGPVEDPQNPDLNWEDRERALSRKSAALRNHMQHWYHYTIDQIYEIYRELLKEQEDAFKLLPFYSATGEKLHESELSTDKDTSETSD